MWIAKFVMKHYCILGNRCEKFRVTLQSVNYSTFVERRKGKKETVTTSMHYMSGDSKKIDAFVKDLSKDRNVIKLERKGDMFFLLERADNKAVQFYTPKILFVRPTLIDHKGYEHWEIGSWEKEEVSRFINKVKTKMNYFKLERFSHVKMDNIFFPKLMPDLTEKQKHAIDLAIEEGYYQSPRKIDLRKLAKLMNVSLATYQQHLRVGEEKLIPNLISYSN